MAAWILLSLIVFYNVSIQILFFINFIFWETSQANVSGSEKNFFNTSKFLCVLTLASIEAIWYEEAPCQLKRIRRKW